MAVQILDTRKGLPYWFWRRKASLSGSADFRHEKMLTWQWFGTREKVYQVPVQLFDTRKGLPICSVDFGHETKTDPVAVVVVVILDTRKGLPSSSANFARGKAYHSGSSDLRPEKRCTNCGATRNCTNEPTLSNKMWTQGFGPGWIWVQKPFKKLEKLEDAVTVLFGNTWNVTCCRLKW